MSKKTQFQFSPNLPIIIVTCYGRSGSVLLQSLLDAHPEIISTPAHSFVKPPALKEPIIFLAEIEGKSVDELVSSTVHNFPHLFRETDQTRALRAAAAKSVIGVPQDAFEKALGAILSHENINHDKPGDYIRAVHYAYHGCLGRDVSKVKAIVWQLHRPFEDERFKFWLANTLRNVRFLLPVRRPEVTISSHFAAKVLDKHFRSAVTESSVLISQLMYAGRSHESLVNYSAAVRFEDVHSETERVTRALAKWVGIDWHPVMLEPTVDGEEMLFPKGDTVVRGFNAEIEQKQSAKHFNRFDEIVFYAFNWRAYEKWGYESFRMFAWMRWLIKCIAIFVPMRMERMLFQNDLSSGQKFFTAIKTAFVRRYKTYKSLMELAKLNSGKTDCRLVDLLEI